jgi:hypothetical protein
MDPGVKKRRRISFESTKLIASSQNDVNFHRRDVGEHRADSATRPVLISKLVLLF